MTIPAHTIVAMPEGDTAYKTAVALRTALAGKTSIITMAPVSCVILPSEGCAIEDVRSKGKHIEIIWDDGVVMHSHMRMTGAWHLYRPGESWRKPEHRARVVIETRDWVAVCFSAPIIETYRADGWRRHPFAGQLGPDLCDPRANLYECARRIMEYHDPEATIADVLLDQRVMCGVGNVYRCEILWATEVSPRAAVGTIAQSTAIEIVQTAAHLIRANLKNAGRVTVPGVPGGLAVYGRNGKSCLRCRGVVQVRRMGEDNRIVYWCPECQKRHVPRPRADDSNEVVRMIDSHPVASDFLRDLAQRRPLNLDHEAFDEPDSAIGSAS